MRTTVIIWKRKGDTVKPSWVISSLCPYGNIYKLVGRRQGAERLALAGSTVRAGPGDGKRFHAVLVGEVSVEAVAADIVPAGQSLSDTVGSSALVAGGR